MHATHQHVEACTKPFEIASPAWPSNLRALQQAQRRGEHVNDRLHSTQSSMPLTRARLHVHRARELTALGLAPESARANSWEWPPSPDHLKLTYLRGIVLYQGTDSERAVRLANLLLPQRPHSRTAAAKQQPD